MLHHWTGCQPHLLQLLGPVLHAHGRALNVALYAVNDLTLVVDQRGEVFENFVDIPDVRLELPHGPLPVLELLESVLLLQHHLCPALLASETLPRARKRHVLVKLGGLQLLPLLVGRLPLNVLEVVQGLGELVLEPLPLHLGPLVPGRLQLLKLFELGGGVFSQLAGVVLQLTELLSTK